MKLFISYRRAAWSFTCWLAEDLGKLLDTEIFVDFLGIDETNFESALLRNLRESDVVLLIVTEHTFAPERIHNDRDWVRREIVEALAQKKPIVLACHNGLMPPADLPDDIQEIRKSQGIEFYPRYFKAGIHELAAFIDRATPIKLKRPIVVAEKPTQVPLSKTKPDKGLFDEATALAEAGQYDRAIETLQALKARGYKPRYIALDDVLADVIRDREAEQRRWEAGEIYDEIVSVARVNSERASAMYSKFRVNYPEYTEDPARIGPELTRPTESRIETVKTPIPEPEHVKRPASLDILPEPFAWIEVPAGTVMLESIRKFDVPAFAIAKYPTTNDQFAGFIKAGGYNHEKWWTDEGWQVKEKENWMKPRYWEDSKWNKPDYPLVGVSWFEAVAFCLWLSDITGECISLPTEQQWQWAAQGDKNWAYPWGKEFDRTRCNNSVGIDWQKNSTSPVTRYEGKGDSLFGVVDMSGNAWEWCLTDYEHGTQDIDSKAIKRVLRGGAWYLNDEYLFRVDYRGENFPGNGNDFGGIRLVRIM